MSDLDYSARDVSDVPSPTETSASRRILRDLRNFLKDRPDGIWAGPACGDDSNIFKWDVVIEPRSGPLCFERGPQFKYHFTATFPDDYPHSPLDLTASTQIPHPNCYSGGWICLDLLQDRRISSTYVGGWSPAYDVRSILLNVQSFLFDWMVPQDYHYGAGDTFAENEISEETRQDCFHNALRFTLRRPDNFSCVGSEVMAQDFPECIKKTRISWHQSQQMLRDTEQKWGLAIANSTDRLAVSPFVINYSSKTTIDHLPDDILEVILGQLDDAELSCASRAWGRFEDVIQAFNIRTKRNLQCFFTKEPFGPATLGFGVALGGHRFKKFSMDFDLLSSQAFFVHGVNTSVFGNSFNTWIPAPLNRAHSAKVLPYLEGLFGMLSSGRKVPSASSLEGFSEISAARGLFDPEAALDTICTIMNKLVVQLMNQDEKVVHHSESALLGYYQLHHILLLLANSHPEIAELAEDIVEDFIANEGSRCKAVTPDLGKFIILLTLLPGGTWRRAVPGLVKESFDRNVRYLLPKVPELARVETGTSQFRVDSTFAATKTSLSLLMFQAHFLSIVEPAADKTRADQLEQYWMAYGRPTPSVVEHFQETCAKIIATSSWDEFHGRVGLKIPSQEILCDRLKTAVKRSAMKGYHFNRLQLDGPQHESLSLPLHDPASHKSYTDFVFVDFGRMRRVEDEMLAMARQFSPTNPVRICANFHLGKGLIAFAAGSDVGACIEHLRRHGFAAGATAWGSWDMKECWFGLWKCSDGGQVGTLRWNPKFSGHQDQRWRNTGRADRGHRRAFENGHRSRDTPPTNNGPPRSARGRTAMPEGRAGGRPEDSRPNHGRLQASNRFMGLENETD